MDVVAEVAVVAVVVVVVVVFVVVVIVVVAVVRWSTSAAESVATLRRSENWVRGERKLRLARE